MPPQKTIPFTLHVRLTKACNANCTYCSSFMENPDKYMNLESYQKSIEFFWSKLQEKNINVTNLTIEYVGGEILLVPPEVLKSQVLFARDFFKKQNVNLSDGAQTNLIGSKRKVIEIQNLFDGRISTSIDSFTDQRRVGDSAKKYKVIMMTRENDIMREEQSLSRVPAVFTMDKTSIKFTEDEVNKARRENRNLMIRPVFIGGSSIESITPDELADVLVSTFDKWFMRSMSILDPHMSLLEKRIQTKLNVDPMYERSYCSFQNDCAAKSMSLEPNGDLYVCQELADAGKGKIGNTLNDEWDDLAWTTMSKRGENLDSDCLSCPYLKDCQGGCMMHAIQDGNGPYGKPSYCKAWKAIFARIDKALEDIPYDRIESWLKRLKVKQIAS
ncbi:SPASM domain-containing protein [Psychromonas sp. SP041]|uniref:radical SAM protein n=1 Tax=Psychromonas sp. SP041 TaxID=1365007 RepID=UPI0010C7AA88|nr:SPASM domain-containing protein [Psychromonas sp. SP041]